MINIKLDRLLNQLNISPIASKDKQLYQVVAQLIKTLKDVTDETNIVSETVNNVVNNIANGKFNGLTVPLFTQEGFDKWEYSDNPYPSLTAGILQTIINNNNNNVINNNLLTTESIDDRYYDSPYPSLGTSLPVPVSSAGNPTITDDNATNATMYPVWVTAAGVVPLNISTTKLNWNPNTAVFDIFGGSIAIVGNGAGTSIFSFSNNFNGLAYGRIANSTNGTAAISAISLENDLNFGFLAIYSSGFTTSGHKIADGVSLYTDASAGLTIAATNTTGIVSIFTGGSAVANKRMTILANGNVGIGIVTPTLLLSVQGDIDNNAGAYVQNINTGTAAYTTFGAYNNLADASLLYVYSSNYSGTLYGINRARLSELRLDGITGGMVDTGGSGGALYFGTGGATPSLTILDDGKVGIGTIVPTGPLQVNTGTTGVRLTTSDFVLASTGSVMILKMGAATGNTYSAIDSVHTGGTVAANLVLCGSGGNVGIGDTSPDALLDVAGTGQFDGIVTFLAPIRFKGYTVATLPAGVQGYFAFVTDALAPAYHVTVVGGGAVVVPVFYNGTNWIVN